MGRLCCVGNCFFVVNFDADNRGKRRGIALFLLQDIWTVMRPKTVAFLTAYKKTNLNTTAHIYIYIYIYML